MCKIRDVFFIKYILKECYRYQTDRLDLYISENMDICLRSNSILNEAIINVFKIISCLCKKKFYLNYLVNTTPTLNFYLLN